MHVLFAILAAIVCAFANRFRGGGLVLLPGETTVPDHKRDTIRRAVFALVYGLVAWNLLIPFVVWASLLPGWGAPIGAAVGGTRKTPFKEFAPFDWLARTVAPGKPRAQGVVWLTAFGLVVGAVAAAVTLNPWNLLWLTMGGIYWLTRDMEYGEWAFGALQGLTLSMWIFTHG